MVLFFKQKTAYEMRISDWSSDVCSSDLEPAPFGDLDRGHHLVPGPRVGHREGRCLQDPLVAAQDALGQQRRDVLRVDPDPVPGATGEVDQAVLVDEAEVTGPKPAVADPLGVCLRVLPVALERCGAGGVDNLADRHLCVPHPAVLVEPSDRALRRERVCQYESLSVVAV